jgi:hypothetical protein
MGCPRVEILAPIKNAPRALDFISARANAKNKLRALQKRFVIGGGRR